MGRGLAGRRYGRRSRPAARRLAGWPGPRMMFGLTGFSGRLACSSDGMAAGSWARLPASAPRPFLAAERDPHRRPAGNHLA